MSKQFWGVALQPGAKQEVKLENDLQLVQVALGDCKNKNDRTLLHCSVDGNQITLGSLRFGSAEQFPLGLVFNKGSTVEFYTDGESPVHISGFFEGVSKKRKEPTQNAKKQEQPQQQQPQEKKEQAKPAAKKAKAETATPVATPPATPPPAKQGDQKKEAAKTPAKTQTPAKQEAAKQESPKQTPTKEEVTPKKETPVKEEKATPKQNKKEKQPQTPTTPQSPKTEAEAPATPTTPKETKTPAKADTKLKPARVEVKTPSKPATEAKTPVKEATTPKSNFMLMPNGLLVEDVVVGTGREANPGNRLSVHYVGRFQKTGKVFDAGKGFVFRLGARQVIKGWDIGIKGMKIGGKRNLTIPPHLAYGSKGIPGSIPAESTLCFEVELTNVN